MKERKIRIFSYDEIKDRKFRPTLKKLNIDLLLVFAVGRDAVDDRRAVVRDEGADPPLKDAPTARACGAWGGAAAVPRAAASSTKAPRGPRAQGSSTARG